MVDWKRVEHGLCETLGEQSRRLQHEFPSLWAKVEAIKAQPGWTPHATGNAELDGWEDRPCARCPKTFVVRSADQRRRYCSHRCSHGARIDRAREAIALAQRTENQAEYARTRNELARILEAADARRQR